MDSAVQAEIENITWKTINYINKNVNNWDFQLNKLIIKNSDSNELIRASIKKLTKNCFEIIFSIF